MNTKRDNTSLKEIATLKQQIEIFGCPNCSQEIKRIKLEVTNGEPGIIYSDRKGLRGNSSSPSIIKCEGCESVYWLSSRNFVKEDEIDVINAPIIELAKPLSYFELNSALSNEESCSDDEMEKYLRIELWWRYNDKYRDVNPIMVGDGIDLLINRKNMRKLIALLDINRDEEKLMVAEVHRNLCEFEKCVQTLKDFRSSKFKNEVGQMIVACAMKNDKVFRIEK